MGAVSDKVEVQSSAETVQTSTSGNYGNLVTAKAVMDLPIVGSRGRNPLDLVVTQPAVLYVYTRRAGSAPHHLVTSGGQLRAFAPRWRFVLSWDVPDRGAPSGFNAPALFSRLTCLLNRRDL